MKKFITLLCIFNMHALNAAMTKDFIVTKLNYDREKKYYDVVFKNQAGVYKADELDLACLQESMNQKKAVRVIFNPIGLKITSCSQVSTK